MNLIIEFIHFTLIDIICKQIYGKFFLWKIRRSVPQTHDYYYYKIMIRLDWIGYFSGFSSSNNDDIKKK